MSEPFADLELLCTLKRWKNKVNVGLLPFILAPMLEKTNESPTHKMDWEGQLPNDLKCQF